MLLLRLKTNTNLPVTSCRKM